MTIGTLAGAIAGYYGGVVDRVIMRFVDAVLSFPMTGLAALVKPNLLTITLIIGVTAWMEVARIVRRQVLSLRERELPSRARAMGVTNWHSIARELLPNAMGADRRGGHAEHRQCHPAGSRTSAFSAMTCSRRSRAGATCSTTRRVTSIRSRGDLPPGS